MRSAKGQVLHIPKNASRRIQVRSRERGRRMIAEKAVLGSMLKENYLIAESNLVASQFTDPTNRTIFQSMTELRIAGKVVDMITLLTTYSPQDLGGANYVNDLTNYAHIEKFDDHVDALLEVWREREKKNVLHISAHEDWSIDRITTELAALTDQSCE